MRNKGRPSLTGADRPRGLALVHACVGGHEPGPVEPVGNGPLRLTGRDVPSQALLRARIPPGETLDIQADQALAGRRRVGPRRRRFVAISSFAGINDNRRIWCFLPDVGTG